MGRVEQVPAALVPHRYVHQVERAGAIAVVLPPRFDADDDVAAALAARLDGLIIAGGVDVAPELYAQERHPTVQASRPDRDAMEIALARVTAHLDLPVLGICRGMQVMAVAAGGSLEQHVPDRVGHDDHSPAPTVYGTHVVDTVAGTQVADLLGERLEVPSYHHQSVLDSPRLPRRGLGAGRHPRGDGGAGCALPRSRCSGTRRSAPTPASSTRSSRRPRPSAGGR